MYYICYMQYILYILDILYVMIITINRVMKNDEKEIRNVNSNNKFKNIYNNNTEDENVCDNK